MLMNFQQTFAGEQHKQRPCAEQPTAQSTVGGAQNHYNPPGITESSDWTRR